VTSSARNGSFSESTHDKGTTERVLHVLTNLVKSLKDLVKTRPAIFALRATSTVGAISSEGMDVSGVSGSGEGLIWNVRVDSLVRYNSRNVLAAVDV
jgi:hypothetical protein